MADLQAQRLSKWARGRRHDWMLDRFPQLSGMRVLDLGGEQHTWTSIPVQPREVVLLNIPVRAATQQVELRESGLESWMRAVAGDACDPPKEIRSDHFDLVYSNSVIEHVGGHSKRIGFARSVAELGDRHWIQTPNRYFPVEPHWYFPGFQFLPVRARAAITQVWPFGHFVESRDSLEQRMNDVLDIELLTPSEMRFYFPESELLRERVLGVTKSLIAVR